MQVVRSRRLCSVVLLSASAEMCSVRFWFGRVMGQRRKAVRGGMGRPVKREPSVRPTYPVLSVAQQLALGTGHYAEMRCSDCQRFGCLRPVPHKVKA